MFFAFSTQCTLLCFIRFDLYYLQCKLVIYFRDKLLKIYLLKFFLLLYMKLFKVFYLILTFCSAFCMYIQTNDKYGILFVMSSYGYLHVIDVNDSICLYEGILTNYKVVSPAAYKDSGIVCVNEKGYIVTAVVDEEEVISCLSIVLKNKSAVMKFARRCNLPGAEGVFAWKFWELCDNGEYYKAAELAVIIHVDSLATEKIIEYLRSAKLGKKEPNPAIECLSEKYQLNSAALIGDKNCTKEDYISIFQQTVNNQKAESSHLP
ncbi:Clathrin heavy chain 1 [Trichinella sp. T8]|nr:Clathrin heavy chain 1 [Trichinella sp. T8]